MRKLLSVSVRVKLLSRTLTPFSHNTFCKHNLTLGVVESRMRHDATSASTAKYCAVCGRLISPHVRNFNERKYCSKSCSSTRLTELDHEIEDEIVKLALRDGQIGCQEVQTVMGERIGRYPLTGAEQIAGLDEVTKEESQARKTQQGNDEAVFRERVRRAARRVVVNGRDGESFLCWSQGKAAEPSFAKGDWAVKHLRS